MMISSSMYVSVSMHTRITSAESNNKTRLNVKSSLSNFNAGVANKGSELTVIFVLYTSIYDASLGAMRTCPEL